MQYVLSKEHQILVCETSTILFAFCGMSLQNQPTWSYCGRMYLSPGLMRRIPHQAPTRCSAAAAGCSAVSHRQFVCTFSAGASPPAISFSRGRGMVFFFVEGELFTPEMSHFTALFEGDFCEISSQIGFGFDYKWICCPEYLFHIQVWLAALFPEWLERGRRFICFVCCPSTPEQLWIKVQSSCTESL